MATNGTQPKKDCGCGGGHASSPKGAFASFGSTAFKDASPLVSQKSAPKKSSKRKR